MKHKTFNKTVELIGIIFLIAFGFLPLAKVNNLWITLFPIYNNLMADFKVWQWRDVSAFALTHLVLCVSWLFFYKKKLLPARWIFIAAFLVNTLFILFIVWLSKQESAPINEINFTFSFSWVFLIIGLFLLSFSNLWNQNSST